jgi:hypothetical protein
MWSIVAIVCNMKRPQRNCPSMCDILTLSGVPIQSRKIAPASVYQVQPCRARSLSRRLGRMSSPSPHTELDEDGNGIPSTMTDGLLAVAEEESCEEGCLDLGTHFA